WLHAGDGQGKEPPRGIDDRHINAFRVHGIQLHLRRPAALLERPPALLIVGVVVTLPPAARIGRASHPSPRLAVESQPQVARVLGQARRRPIAKLRVDVALPQVGGFDDVDIAVQDLKLLVHIPPPYGLSCHRRVWLAPSYQATGRALSDRKFMLGWYS